MRVGSTLVCDFSSGHIGAKKNNIRASRFILDGNRVVHEFPPQASGLHGAPEKIFVQNTSAPPNEVGPICLSVCVNVQVVLNFL